MLRAVFAEPTGVLRLRAVVLCGSVSCLLDVVIFFVPAMASSVLVGTDDAGNLISNLGN